ncbi:hypothetical protein [Nocardioides jejuensis]|uniref:Uncharacterized protein n=1 Tax=Nocardioides jejuensis TaxID=2502782 RepID=A0A4R1CFU3_9ACTN|nr:hypothetical protein [Nocardioides jejuensis]TCJ30060.1 hypothetical protein EPD65_05615 [Nocardioides jejuensis]
MADRLRRDVLPRWFGFLWAFVAVTAIEDRHWPFAAMATLLAVDYLLRPGAKAQRWLELAAVGCAVGSLSQLIWRHFAS